MMQTTVDRDSLLHALRHVAAVTPRRAMQPILETVRVATGPEGIAITATDRDMWLVELVDHEPRDTWAGCVNAWDLYDNIKSLPKGVAVALGQAEPEMLNVAHNGSAEGLELRPLQDFPPIPTPPKPGAQFRLDADELRNVLRFCDHAVNRDDQRYYLNGIHLAAGVAVATDGHRLTLHTLSGCAPPEGGVIVPHRVCRQLPSLLRSESMVEVSITPPLMTIDSARWQLTTCLIVGHPYPDYQRVFPPRCATPLTINRHDLLATLGRVAPRSHGPLYAVQLAVQDGGLAVAGQEAPQLAPDAVGINARYLADALEAIEGDGVELHIGAYNQPIWFRAAGDQDNGVLIMPMNLHRTEEAAE